MSIANCAGWPPLLIQPTQHFRNTPIGLLVNNRAWANSDKLDPSAGGNTINDSESPDAKTAQSFKLVLECLACVRAGEDLFEGVTDFALQVRMQVLDEAGDVRRDAESMNRALHARNPFPVLPRDYLRSSSSV